LGEVLQVSRTLYGTDHFELSGVLTSLGNIHTQRRELKKALKCHQESLRIRMGCGDELASANSKNNIAACLASVGHIDEAKFLYAEALLVKSKSLGIKHVETARTLYNLGQLYASDQQHRLAEQFYREGKSTDII
jgi:tetratricopeptide (TPR) repeat protein